MNSKKLMNPNIEPIHSLSRQSPCLAPNSKACCWQRCIKRKSNDGLGLQVEGFIMPRKEGSNLNIPCEPAWGTMPQISHCPKGSCNVRKSRSSSVLQNEKLDKSVKPSLRGSKSGIISHKPCLAADCDTLHSYNFTNCSSENHYMQSQHIQEGCLGLSSKKRGHVAMSDEYVCGSEDLCDLESQNEIIKLRETLKFERKALRKLNKELEKERCASAAAASEAMAMIRRLQEEKSAALVESRHYRLASEERETYNQEAITLLKEALLVLENEVCSLQEHVKVYRSMILKIKSRQGNRLEGIEDDEQLFLLEGNQLAPFSLVNPSEPLYYSQIGITDITEEQGSDDMMKCHRLLSGVTQQGHDFEGSHCESHKSDLESNNIFGSQDLEDVSMSILDRVARLEERFACLGHNQAFDPDCFDWVSHDTIRNIDDSAGQRNVEQHLSPTFSRSSGKLRVRFSTENHQDPQDLRFVGRVTTNSEHNEQEHSVSARHEGSGLGAFEIKSKGYSRGLSQGVCQESTFLHTGDTEIEGVHDVYEVRCDPNSCGIPSTIESSKSLATSMDAIVNDSLQVFEDKVAEPMLSLSVKDTLPVDHLEGFITPADGKLLSEVRIVDEEAMKNSAVTEDVDNLKLRLQALEGERAFMKVAIDSLRKENMELKLLQDIAQQLHELKGDVWKTRVKGPGRHGQLPFLSFLKGILSFAGMRSRITEKRRFLHPCQESSGCNSSYKVQGQPGLFYLLNYPSEEVKDTRVMRECKIKLGSVRAQVNPHDCN